MKKIMEIDGSLAQCQAREGAAQCAHRNAGSSTKHPLRGRNAGIR